MKISTAHNVVLIHHLKTLHREIPLEGEAQLATIARMFWHNIPEIIEKIKRLEEYESGKSLSGNPKETNRISLHVHEPRH